MSVPTPVPNTSCGPDLHLAILPVAEEHASTFLADSADMYFHPVGADLIAPTC